MLLVLEAGQIVLAAVIFYEFLEFVLCSLVYGLLNLLLVIVLVKELWVLSIDVV